MKKLLLIGGGHSHVEVIRRFGLQRQAGIELTLVSPQRLTPYSGMLPGLVAGNYSSAQCHIDLSALSQAADCRLLQCAVIGIQPESKLAFCDDGNTCSYDIVSIDIGSRPGMLDVRGAAEHALGVKPTERFLPAWGELLERAQRRKLPRGFRIVIVGGGAAGVEILLSLQYRLACAGARDVGFALIADTAEVPHKHPEKARRIFSRVLRERNVSVHLGQRAIEVTPSEVVTDTGARIAADLTVWATGASSPFWPRACGLAVDDQGFIRVNTALQSVNQPAVFAAGDIASMDGPPRPKSGVYAVRQGPPLAENLRRALCGESLRPYRPQRQALALISTGNPYAVASRGWLVMEGAWVWRWKDWIDRRFMRRYRFL